MNNRFKQQINKAVYMDYNIALYGAVAQTSMPKDRPEVKTLTSSCTKKVLNEFHKYIISALTLKNNCGVYVQNTDTFIAGAV